jgi:hypothetical protein
MKIIHPILFLLIIGCSTSIDSLSDLDEGQALLRIDNIKYNAKAVMDHQVLVETEFEKISLIINDSVRIEILKEIFVEEKIFWNIENHISQDLIFSLKYNYFGGSIYMPLEGYFSLSQRTASNITGEFEITLTGGAVSCIACPEALKNVKGKFIVKAE